MNLSSIATISVHELKIVIRNKWLLSFTILFTSLAVATVLFGIPDEGAVGFDGFNRMTATLLNLSLYLVPIIALIIGSSSIAGDREEGGLSLLLTYPLTPFEVIIGKYIGLLLSLFAVIGFSYGLAGIIISFQSESSLISTYLLFVGLTFLLTLIYLAVAMLIGVLSTTRMQAFGISILAWAGSVLIYEFIIMGVALTLTNQFLVPFLSASILLNPADLIRVWTVLMMGSGTIFGPNMYSVTIWADSAAGNMTFTAIAILWITLPLLLAKIILKRRLKNG